MRTGDTQTLRDLTADPCLVVGSQGVRQLSKSELTEIMRDQDYRVSSFTVDDGNVAIRKLSDDMAVIAYRVHEESNRDGTPQALDAFDSSVWIRNGGRWQCAAHTESVVSHAMS
jgi:hypothetical protein